jgi:hypothetical protein
MTPGDLGYGGGRLQCLRDDPRLVVHRPPAPTAGTVDHLETAILDDWGPEPLDAEQRRDLLEIVEDRYEARSIIVTSQLPVDRWYEIIGNPTIADAILDRLVHNAHRIELKGESLRKKRPPEIAGTANATETT